MTRRIITLTLAVEVDDALAKAADDVAWPDGSTEWSAALDLLRSEAHHGTLSVFQGFDPIVVDGPTITSSTEPEATAPFLISPPDAAYDIDYWSVTGDLRRSDWDDANYDARDDLRPHWPNIEFDPETSCFYAYAKTEEDAQAFAAALTDWLAQR